MQYQERRKAPRLSLSLKFTYKLADSQEILLPAFTKNISASGLLFESERQIPLDTKLLINLIFSFAEGKIFTFTGRVVRIERLASSKFNIGVNFEDVPEEIRQEFKIRIEQMDIVALLEVTSKKEVSDVHLTAGSPAMVRQHGEIKPLNNNALSAEEIRQMVYSILSEENKKIFEERKDLDFSFSPSINLRYRVSIYQQRGMPEVVFRNIMPHVRSREELGLPDIISDLSQDKDGLIIIAGTTGSGKTTTITTIIDIINRARGGVILSLEKPIEYLHKNIKGIVKQREVGSDVLSFAAGLKAALRQDPDIIVVGETLDYDTIETTLEAAETGHLVITSLHATDTVQVFDRIISFFPLEQRDFIYSRLSHSLRAVIMQKLLPHKDGVSRVVATEVCVVNTAVSRVIRSGNFTQLPSIIQTGAKYNMHTMQDSIDRLFEKNLISSETYEMYSKPSM